MGWDERPVYRFRFVGGISACGVAVRTRLNQGLFGSEAQQDHIQYQVDDAAILAHLSRTMSSIEADLIDVMLALYIADRQAPRNGRQRRMHAEIPVRSPEIWSSQEVHPTIRELLEFSANERWGLSFVPRRNDGRVTETQLTLPIATQAKAGRVLLYSGGLDSVAGIAASLQAAWPGQMLLATIETHRRTHGAAIRTADLVRGLPGGQRLGPVVSLKVGISRGGRPKDDREKTQRTRSLLYLAYGTVLASLTGLNQLHVFENGIGAINLSMTSDHLGHRVSRAMHPRTLSLMSKLASTLLGRPFSIQNLGLWMTKGEATQMLVNSPYSSALSHAITCDHSVYLSPGVACGKCPSCLLRRVSVEAAGLRAISLESQRYQFDPFRPDVKWEVSNIQALIAMHHQAGQMHGALGSPDPFRALAVEFPEVYDILRESESLGMSADEIKDAIIRLLTEYVAEFDGFFSGIGAARSANMATIGSPLSQSTVSTAS